MKMQLSDIVDKATILTIKERNGLDIEKKELDELLIAAHGVDPVLFDTLLMINASMWDIEAEIGRKYLELKELTMKRSELKNKITEKHGGYKEKKRY